MSLSSSKKIALIAFLSPLFLLSNAYAETVSGGGYVIQQEIAPINGGVSGNGFVVQGASQQTGEGNVSGGGFSIFSSFGGQVPVVTPPTGGGGGGGGVSYSGGGGYFILAVPTSTLPVVVSSTTPNVPKTSTSTTIITENGSSCKERVVFSGPIDINSPHNVKEDVEKLESFLNVYENEKLAVNGVYEVKDIAAVKKWQTKYKTYILDPMRLSKPTGTVYTLSQKQIERQTSKSCGQPVTITTCPYFTTYTKYGDRGQEVKKIQQFLNIVQGEKLPTSGVYGPSTRDAVKRFQRYRRKYVFSFISLEFISGNWNVSTRTKANEVLGCGIIKS